MTLIPWILLLLLLVEHVLFIPRLLDRAGATPWHGYIPGLNYIAWLKIIGRPWYWALLLVVPGINLLMWTIMQVEMGIAFNQRSMMDQWKMGLIPWVFIAKLSLGDDKYVGARDWSKQRKSVGREWGESLLWALIVASIVRTFIFEAFTIPTASMEGSMLVGDYLYVSKTSYGPKVPQTPVSIPLIHNVLPGTMIPSYTEWFALPYKRLMGMRSVERYDAVVFNFPPGDTIVVDSELAGHDYYGILRREALAGARGDREAFKNNSAIWYEEARGRLKDRYGLMARPVDKTENYVKRCIALPGETLEVVGGMVRINGETIVPPDGVQWEYELRFANQMDARRAMKSLDLTNIDLGNARMEGDQLLVNMALTQSEVTSLEAGTLAIEVNQNSMRGRRGSLEMFPNVASAEFDQWDPDDFGPVMIPKAGLTIPLTSRNIALYRRVIDVYERHELSERGGKIFIDGVESSEYTFEMDHYWMMGDNRHRSADSRMWGFVPETHIVGRASFIWFSKQNKAQHGESKIRWNRMFQSVK